MRSLHLMFPHFVPHNFAYIDEIDNHRRIMPAAICFPFHPLVCMSPRQVQRDDGMRSLVYTSVADSIALAYKARTGIISFKLVIFSVSVKTNIQTYIKGQHRA